MRRLSACLPRLLPVLGLLAPSLVLANVVGTDAQNFNPTTDGLDFVTVQSSKTLLPGILNIGLYWNEAWDELPRFKDQPTYTDHLLGMDLNFGLGLAPRWDVGVSIPSVLNQSVTTQSGFSGQYSSNGFTEVRLNTKYRLTGEDRGGTALIGSVDFNEIENDPYAGAGAGPTFNLEGVADHTFGKIAAALNVGYRFRDAGTQIPGIPIQPFHNQWIASIAANYLMTSWDTKVIGEVFGSLPSTSTNDDENLQSSSLEALLGLKHDFTTNIAGHFGVGRELVTGLASPEFRVYAGVNLQLGPIFGVTKETVESALAEVTVPGEPLEDEKFTLRKIPFETASAALQPSARPILDELAAHLKSHPFSKLTIEGHTDSVGSAEYNLTLSDARANTIKMDLIKTYHFDAAKIEAIGYGLTRPIADNGNYQGREANRRVEFKIAR